MPTRRSLLNRTRGPNSLPDNADLNTPHGRGRKRRKGNQFGDPEQDFPKVDRLQNKEGPLPDLSRKQPPPFGRPALKTRTLPRPTGMTKDPVNAPPPGTRGKLNERQEAMLRRLKNRRKKSHGQTA